MVRIFVGLVKRGAWGCFERFNRLEEVVLSTMSMDIQVIQAAIKSKTSMVELLVRKVIEVFVKVTQNFVNHVLFCSAGVYEFHVNQKVEFFFHKNTHVCINMTLS